MDCESFNKNLDSFETLNEKTKKAMYEHTKACENCKNEMEFMLSVMETVKNMPRIEPPSDFMDRLNERIDAEEKLKRSVPNRIRQNIRSNWRVYASAAACFALIAVLTANKDILLDRFSDTGDVIQTETVVSEGTPVPVMDTSEIYEAVVDEGAPPAQTAEQTQIKPANTQQKKPQTSPSATPQKTVTKAAATNTATAAPQVSASAAETSQNAKPIVVSAPTSEPETKIAAVSVDESYGEEAGEAETYSSKSRAAVKDVEKEYSLAENRNIAKGSSYGAVSDRRSDKPVGKIKINSKDAEKAINLALKYSYGVEGNMYYTDSPNFRLLLSSFSNEGVTYADYTPGYDGDIAFCLVLV